MDPFSLLIILLVVGLVVWLIFQNRKRAKSGPSNSASSSPASTAVQEESVTPSPTSGASDIGSRDREVIRLRHAVTAIAKPLLIWANFQIAAGVFFGIGMLVLFDDPAGFATGGFVPVLIGAFINLLGIIVAVIAGWRHLSLSR